MEVFINMYPTACVICGLVVAGSLILAPYLADHEACKPEPELDEEEL